MSANDNFQAEQAQESDAATAPIHGFIWVDCMEQAPAAISNIASLQPTPTIYPGIDKYDHDQTFEALFRRAIQQVCSQPSFWRSSRSSSPSLKIKTHN